MLIKLLAEDVMYILSRASISGVINLSLREPSRQKRKHQDGGVARMNPAVSGLTDAPEMKGKLLGDRYIKFLLTSRSGYNHRL